MKIGFIFVLYKTPESEIERLRKEIEDLRFKNYEIYFINNTENNIGYAGGVNQGIKKALKDGCDLFIIANPDISLKVKVHPAGVLEASRYFDIWGLTMRQQGKLYYGGEIDNWRMSGGLVDKKPKNRFQSADFVSGSLMVIKKKVIDKIGFFDESYFLYYEEVDYCYRAKKAGFRVGIDSAITYDHFEISKDNPEKNYFLFKNRLKFLFKYGKVKQKLYEFLRVPKTIYEEVIKRPFYLNFFSLNLSSLVNKVLHFVFFLILIRTFIPSEYAVYTLAWTQIGLLLPLLDFGTTSYGLVYLPRKDNIDFSTLFSFRVILSIITYILTIGLALIFHYPTKILIPIFLISIVIFANMFSGSYLILTSVAEKVYLVSLVSMIFQIVLVLSLIVTILITAKLMPVFIVTGLLYGVYAIVNFILIKSQVKNLQFKISISSWIGIAKKSIVFLLISLLAGFYSKADVLILNFIKGTEAVGVYSAGYRFLDALMFMITAYNVSAMPVFSRLAKTSKKLFREKIVKDVILVLSVGLVTSMLIFFFAPIVLPFFMKGDYRQSIAVLRIIIFSLPLILLTSIFLNCLYALNRAVAVVGLFIFQLVYNVVTNIIFIPKFSYFASAWITIGGEILNTLLSFAILRSVLKKVRPD